MGLKPRVCSDCTLSGTVGDQAPRWGMGAGGHPYMSPWGQSLKACQYHAKNFRRLSFFKKIYLFIVYFWLRWVFVAARGLSLVAASRGYSSWWCVGFSLRWLLLLWSTGSRRTGFSSCGTRAQQLWLMGSRAQAQQLWHTGLVAPQHVGSSRTRAQTCVHCIGRRILNLCDTREVPGHLSQCQWFAHFSQITNTFGEKNVAKPEFLWKKE